MAADTLAMQATLDASSFYSGLDQMAGRVAGFNTVAGAAGANMGRFGSVVGLAGGAFGVAAIGAAALGAGLIGSVKAAASYQTAMTGVAKTTGLEGAELQNLSKDILNMSTTMPITANELANVAKVAGSLGVPTGDIAEFTKTAAMMGVAFEMPADQAAEAGAKILTSFQRPMKDLDNLGNVVNKMGDSFAATEPEVLDFVNRASFLHSSLNQNIPQVAALGTTLISTGMSSETAATGIKSLLNEALDPKKIGAFAEMLGVSSTEVGATLEQDLGGSLIKVADNLAAIEDPAERFNKAFQIAGSYGAMSLLKLTGQTKNFTDALGKANNEWSNGNSMMQTFEKNSETLDSQMQILMNTLFKAGVELGNVMLPAVTGLVINFAKLAEAGTWAGEQIYQKFLKIGPLMEQFGKTGLGKWMSDVSARYDELMAPKGPSAADLGVISDTYADMGEDIISTWKPKAGAARAQAISDFTTWGKEYAEMAKTMSGEMAAYLKGGWISDKALALINQQSDANADEITTRAFEYLGKRFEYRMRISDKDILRSLWATDAMGNMVRLSSEAIDEGLKRSFITPTAYWSKVLPTIKPPEKGSIPYLYLWGMDKEAVEKELMEAQAPPAVSAWDVADTQRNWDRWQWQNEGLAKTAGSEVVLGLYNAMNSAAMKASDSTGLTLQESFGYIMQSLGAPGSVPEKVLTKAVEDFTTNAVISADIGAAILKAGLARTFAEGYYGAAGVFIDQATVSARERVKSGEALKWLYYGTPEQQAQARSDILANVTSIGKYQEQQWQIEWDRQKSEVSRGALAISDDFWLTFGAAWRAQGASWEGEFGDRAAYFMGTVTEQYGGFEEFIAKANLPTQIAAANWLFDGMTQKINQTGQAMGYLKENTDACGASLSAFGTWQEATPELFETPYIGPTAGWLSTIEENLQKTQAAAAMIDYYENVLHRPVARLGLATTYEAPPGGIAEVYGQIPAQKEISLIAKLDEFDTTIAGIKIDPKEITVTANISAATAAIGSIYSEYNSPIVIPVYVEIDATMANIDIDAAVDAAISRALYS